MLSFALGPALNPLWSKKVLHGNFHREILTEMGARWKGSTGTYEAALACLDAVAPLTHRTLQAGAIVADKICCLPVDALGIFAAAGGGAIGFIVGAFKLPWSDLEGLQSLTSAAQTGAALGFRAVKDMYVLGLRMGLVFCCVGNCLCQYPVDLLKKHSGEDIWKSAVRAPSHVEPLRASQVQNLLKSLERQGTGFTRLVNTKISFNTEKNMWSCRGEINVGLFRTNKFDLTVSCENNLATGLAFNLYDKNSKCTLALEGEPLWRDEQIHVSGSLKHEAPTIAWGNNVVGMMYHNYSPYNVFAYRNLLNYGYEDGEQQVPSRTEGDWHNNDPLCLTETYNARTLRRQPNNLLSRQQILFLTRKVMFLEIPLNKIFACELYTSIDI